MSHNVRIPRKLKKGCRTLKDIPRNKWQRKGQAKIKKTMERIAITACAIATVTDLLR